LTMGSTIRYDVQTALDACRAFAEHFNKHAAVSEKDEGHGTE